VAPQVAGGEGASEAMQRVVGMGHGNEPHLREGRAGGARGIGADRHVDAALGQHLVGAREHRLVDLDARIGTLARELLDTFEQQPRGKDDFRRNPDFRLPFPRHRRGAALEEHRFLEQGARTPVQHVPRLRKYRLAAVDLEDLHAEELLDLLHRVRERGLALVQRFGRLRVPAGVHHGLEGAPLLEGDAGCGGHGRTVRWIQSKYCAFLSNQ
jgi:hypothetical protein